MAKMAITESTYGTCSFDAIFKETPQFTTTLTQNPVQTGAAVNDHVYQQPITLTIEVGVSDVITSFSSSCFTSGTRSLEAFAYFRKLWESAETLTIGTEYYTYQNMVLKSFTPLKDKTTMTAMRATVVFQQIIVTQATEIGIAQKDSSYPDDTKQTNAGAQSATQSSKYGTLKIQQALFISAQAVYNGKTMSLNDYINQYSSSKAKYSDLSQYWNWTPLISAAVSAKTAFIVSAQNLTYDQFVSKFAS